MGKVHGWKAKPVPQSVLDQLESSRFVQVDQHPDERPCIFRLKGHAHIRVEVTAHGLTGSSEVLLRVPGRATELYAADTACTIIRLLAERAEDRVQEVRKPVFR